MRKYWIIGVFFSFFIESYGQIEAIAGKVYKYDTLSPHSYSVAVDALFHISKDEMDKYTDYKFANILGFNYLFEMADLELVLRQMIERQDDGMFALNHYVMLSSGIWKYKPINKKQVVLRTLYLEPVFIFQNNSDRGLQHRFQIGALFHPWSFIRPKFSFYLGIGAVYDWSSWKVNDTARINASSPELREKIVFINHRIDLRKNLYQDYSEFRPMLLLNVKYKLNEILNFNLSLSFQQSLFSPYSKEIQRTYPDLRKVYPYILAHFDMNVKVYKGISLKISAGLDYENNNLALYDSSWEYNILFGGTWEFSNQKRAKTSKQ